MVDWKTDKARLNEKRKKVHVSEKVSQFCERDWILVLRAVRLPLPAYVLTSVCLNWVYAEKLSHLHVNSIILFRLFQSLFYIYSYIISEFQFHWAMYRVFRASYNICFHLFMNTWTDSVWWYFQKVSQIIAHWICMAIFVIGNPNRIYVLVMCRRLLRLNTN